MYVIGMACSGVAEKPYKCETCDVQTPPHCDIVISLSGGACPRTVSPKERYAKIDELMKKTQQERLEYWKNEFSRCVKCYACRQNCPMCYCEVCVVDKNRPVRISTSATLQGNFAWNILRAFHLAGRCVGCAACSAACPAGIDLDLLNLTLAKTAEESFGFRAGTDRTALPLIGTFSTDDVENFIR